MTISPATKSAELQKQMLDVMQAISMLPKRANGAEFAKAKYQREMGLLIAELSKLDICTSKMFEMMLVSLTGDVECVRKKYNAAKRIWSSKSYCVLDLNYIMSLSNCNIDSEDFSYVLTFLDAYPDQTEFYRNLAFLARERGFFDMALSVLEKALKLNNQDLINQYNVTKNIIDLFASNSIDGESIKDYMMLVHKFLIDEWLNKIPSTMGMIAGGGEKLVYQKIYTGLSRDVNDEITDDLINRLIESGISEDLLSLVTVKFIEGDIND